MHHGSSLTIRLFGRFSAELRGAPLPRLRTRKGEWLLALLALRAGQPVTRDWLAMTLWPESDERRALANLRGSLKDLRCALSTAASLLVSPTRRTMALDLADAWIDVLAFDAAIGRDDLASLE